MRSAQNALKFLCSKCKSTAGEAGAKMLIMLSEVWEEYKVCPNTWPRLQHDTVASASVQLNVHRNHIYSAAGRLLQSTFGSNCSLESFWVWCYKFGISEQFLPFLFAEPIELHQVGWGASMYSHFQITRDLGSVWLWSSSCWKMNLCPV